MKYLENFSSLIPGLQGNKIIQRVERMKETGEIQTETEYNAVLNDILSKVSLGDFKPTFEFIALNETKSSSEHFNYLMERVQDDLEVAFIELNNIFSAIKAHDEVFKDRLLEELHQTLKRLEDDADNLTLINNSDNSFDSVEANTFSGDNFGLNQNSTFASELFYDPRTEKTITDNEIGFIDNQEEVLGLPIVRQADISFSEIQVKTAESTGTEKDIKVVDSRVENIVDGDTSTGWTYNVLLKNQKSDGVNLSLECNLADKKEVNYLVIHPVSDFPVLLESIQYTDVDNQLIDIPDTFYFNKTLDKPIRITFTDIIARKFIFNFKQYSSTLFDYNNLKDEIVLDDLKRKNNIIRNVSILDGEIKKTIQNPEIRDLLPLTTSDDISYDIFYHYILAFKEISAGLSAYRDNGYFISKPYQKNTPTLLGLESDETILDFFNEDSSSLNKIGSFEYDIIKKDYNATDEVIRTTATPLLPLGSDKVINERLFFTNKRVIIPLRFLAHSSLNIASNVQLFRNNIELVLGVDWRFDDRLNPLDNSDTNILSGLFETKIEILHNSDTIRNGVYTADYIPRYISEPNEIVRDARSTIYLSSGATEHPKSEGIETIAYSNIFMKISIRNNSFETSKTPKLNFYKILTSSLDRNKHVRI